MDQTYSDYVSGFGLDPSYFTDSSGQPLADNSGSASGFNWSGLTNSVVNGGSNVLTQVLKNQLAGSQLNAQKKLAAAQATNSSSTLKIVIIAVVGLAIVGLAFAFLRRGRGR